MILNSTWLVWMLLLTIVSSVAFADATSQPAGTPAVEKVLPLPGTVFSVEGHTAFIIAPPAADKNRPLPWIWYAPTLPGLPGAEEKWMIEKFLAAGVAIAGIDVDESYGSPAGRRLFTALYEELVTHQGFSPRPCLLARSRGGLMLYNWAAEYPDRVSGIAGIYPVGNLRSFPGLDRACGAYGLTAKELEAQLTKHNPVDRLAPLAKAHVPIFHIHGDSDTVVPLEHNSGLLAERYRALGGSMTLEVVKGQGHNMWEGWFQSQPLVDFAIKRAKEGVKPAPTQPTKQPAKPK